MWINEPMENITLMALPTRWRGSVRALFLETGYMHYLISAKKQLGSYFIRYAWKIEQGELLPFVTFTLCHVYPLSFLPFVFLPFVFLPFVFLPFVSSPTKSGMQMPSFTRLCWIEPILWSNPIRNQCVFFSLGQFRNRNIFFFFVGTQVSTYQPVPTKLSGN